VREQIIRYGEFIVVLKDGKAVAYDSKTGLKMFKGDIERVFNELHEKIEGSLRFDFDDNHGKKKRGLLDWGF